MYALALGALITMQGALTGASHGQEPKAPPAKPTPKLEIKDTKVGTGDAVAFGDRVAVDYVGTLTSGKVFDSSKTPFSVYVGLGEVIKGWDQGLLGMKVGGVRKLRIPPELAYGEGGAGSDIPPNATLLFTVTMRKIEHVKNELKISTTKPGEGAELKVGDSGTFSYTVKLADGKAILDSTKAGPLVVAVGVKRILPGIALGVLGMKLGEKRTVTIPPDLAFGPQGRGPIPANATLTFDLTLDKLEPLDLPSGGKEKRS